MMNDRYADQYKSPAVGSIAGGHLSPERVPEVQSALQSLMNTAERLNGVAERLGSSLTPVLRCEPSSPCGANTTTKTSADVPMANRLRELDAMCMRAEDILNDVHRRLEV